jgi:hypothetical protein
MVQPDRCPHPTDHDRWADTLESIDNGHIRTRPFSPQTNRRVERYQQTLANEFAYANEWNTNQQ